MPLTSTRQSLDDIAVVTPTVLRPSLLRAARSVFGQQGVGAIHLLIGVDAALGERSLLETIARECPPHVRLTVFDPGYSTSRRHGGPHGNAYGGALRSILTQMANARLVAYLDDNDWYAPVHLALLREAIGERSWAHSHRWLADPRTGWPICIDEWDSVGVGRGINQARFGGFCQPSTLMLDQLACADMVHLWAQAAFPDGTGEDRLVFEALRGRPGGESAAATCFCTLNEASVRDVHHVHEFEARGLRWLGDRTLVDRLKRFEDEAVRCLRAGKPEDAEDAVRHGLAIHPYHAGLLRQGAEAARRVGQADKAAACLAQAELLDHGLAPSA